MRGAVAAGHPLTAEAGAQVLREGGNAVDACIAAAAMSWVAESPLTGPGAGGFMLVHRASDNSTRVLDHFVTVPGLGLRRRDLLEMESVAVAFTPESSQMFHIGAASCAVPGAVAGLGEAHRLFGSLPWEVLLEPAIRRAREGVVVTKQQAYLHAILDLILRHTPEARAIYGEEQRLRAGDRLVMGDLAETLEHLAERGAADFYRGELARRISSNLYRGGLARRLYDSRAVGAAVRRLRRRLPEAVRGTTHISVVDGRGNAASLTASTGSGSGVVVPGTGIQLNNMLGEFDLARTGSVPRAGVRFTSGMAPTLVMREGRPRLVVGSAGSLRLRGAILPGGVNTGG